MENNQQPSQNGPKPQGPKLNFVDFSNPVQDQTPKPSNQAQDNKQSKVPNSQESQIPTEEQFKSHLIENERKKIIFKQKSGTMLTKQIYIPGKTPGQPFKENPYRYCYNITKKLGKTNNQSTDKFEYFLYQANEKINHYKASMLKEDNPYNPFNLEADIQMTNVDESQFMKIKDGIKNLYGVKFDDFLAVEGCLEDDKILLGGRQEFLSHFCTLFKFNICFQAVESKALRKTNQMLNDNDALNAKVDEWMRKFDDIK